MDILFAYNNKTVTVHVFNTLHSSRTFVSES